MERREDDLVLVKDSWGVSSVGETSRGTLERVMGSGSTPVLGSMETDERIKVAMVAIDFTTKVVVLLVVIMVAITMATLVAVVGVIIDDLR